MHQVDKLLELQLQHQSFQQIFRVRIDWFDLHEVQRDSQESSPAHAYSGILAIKRNEIVPFVETQMDLESAIQREVSQKEKNKYRMLIYMWNLEK